jgi:ketosteroid isomerase-like protein
MATPAPGEAETLLIARLYRALADGDGDTMAACYAPNAVFEDPAFGELHGPQIGAMWRMLCARATSIDVELREHGADGETGHAHWIARYPFAATGNHVVNDIQAKYRFADGLIVDHRDTFDLRRWAAQALGTQGKVLGLTPFLGPVVRKRARGQLDEFMRTDRAA